MKSWRDDAVKMRSDGATLRQIAEKFGVSISIVQYETSPRTREMVRLRTDRQRADGSRQVVQMRYSERRRQRMLDVAREYGCGDVV